MFEGCRIAAIVPAHNESARIRRTLSEVPAWVDQIIAIDDASSDTTYAQMLVQAQWDPRVEVLQHPDNHGVGAAIVSGYRIAIDTHCDIAVVMAGDGQMDPADLPVLLRPLVDGSADYVKGNRFLHRSIWREMPPTRIVGNALLSTVTRYSSGYRHVFDSQCGYTAITRTALARLTLSQVFPRYGYPNDLLARLHRARLRVVDVPVRSVYGDTSPSGIGVRTVLYPIGYVILRSWIGRVRAESAQRSS